VVVVRPGLHLAALGLERDDGPAPPQSVEAEMATGDGGIGLGLAPGGKKRLAERLRQGGKRVFVGRNRPFQHFGGEGGAKAFAGHFRPDQPQNRLGRGERVEADGVGELPGLAGVGREDEGRRPIRCRCRGEPVPARHPIGDRRDAARIGAVGKAGILQIGIAAAGALEAGDAGKDAAVHLGQDDMHGEIGG
jgi:hypothetical protein